MVQLQYSKTDSLLLKGIGILFIVLHNYIHLFPEFPPECEFKYIPENVDRFSAAMLSGDLRLIVFSLFSFLGHYGVSIFVFISGYGLALRYDQSNDSKLHILVHRAVQLWKWLVPMALLLIIDRYSGHTHITYNYLDNQKIWSDLFFMLTFTANGLADRFIIAGPWWYFGMAFQLYFVYTLFLRKSSDKVLWGIMIGVWVLLATLWALDLNRWIFAFRYNCVGWLPVFCTGILLARHPLQLSWKWVTAGGLVFILSLFNPYLWIFSSILVMFPFTALLTVCRKGIAQKVFAALGSLSAALFITHPFVRQQILIYTKNLPIDLTVFIYMGLCLIVAWIYRWVLLTFYKKVHW